MSTPSIKPKSEPVRLEYSTIKAHYSGDEREYTFRASHELMRQLNVGDVVIVKAANGLGLVRITEIHEIPQDTGPYNWKWAFQKVDLSAIGSIEWHEEQDLLSRKDYAFFDDDIPW